MKFFEHIKIYLPEVYEYIMENDKFKEDITDLNFDGISFQVKTFGNNPIFINNFLNKNEIQQKNKFENLNIVEEELTIRLEKWAELIINNDNKATHNKDQTITSLDITSTSDDFPTIRLEIWHPNINVTKITTFTCRFIKNKDVDIWENVKENKREELQKYFKEQILERKNIFFVGNMNTGKSVTMSKIIEYIPKNDTIYSLQDTFDMGLKKMYGNSKFIFEQTYSNSKLELRDFLKSSRRADAKWVFLAEARDEKEMSIIYYLLNSAQSVLTTMHAKDGTNAISYLANTLLFDDKYSKIPIEVIKKTVCQNLSIVVTMDIHKGERVPKISKVEEILGYENGEVIVNKVYDYLD